MVSSGFVFSVQLHCYLRPPQPPGAASLGFGAVSSSSPSLPSSVSASSPSSASGCGVATSSWVLPAPDLLPPQPLLPSAAKPASGILTPARSPAILSPARNFFSSFESIQTSFKVFSEIRLQSIKDGLADDISDKPNKRNIYQAYPQKAFQNRNMVISLNAPEPNSKILFTIVSLRIVIPEYPSYVLTEVINAFQGVNGPPLSRG